MKIKTLAIILILLNYGLINAQTDDVNNLDLNITNSSPDVFAFEKAQLSSIKEYVGKVNVNIPIYTIKSGNVTFPIGLSYDTGGIKVDQLASDIGLGWSISQCLITRNINKGNDFNTVGYKSMPGSNYSFATPLENTNDLNVRNAFKGSLGYFFRQVLNQSITIDRKNIDFVPDQYNFYSSEFSTNFFFQNLNTPIELNPNGAKIIATKSKILFDSKIRYADVSGNNLKYYDFPTEDFFSMSIISKNGIKYLFNDYDLSTSQNYSGGNLTSVHNSINLNPPTISAWHISEIEDTKTGKKISFEYDTTHSNPYHDLGITNTTTNNFTQVRKDAQKSYSYFRASDFVQGQCNYWTQIATFYHKYDENYKFDVQKKRLKRIIFDEGSVEYKYNNEGGSISGISNLREDVYNGDFITQIIIKNNKNEIVKSFDFFYDYFVSNYGFGEFNPDDVFSSKRYKRLKLTGVRENGKPQFTLNYNESIKLPPINSFSVDFLGYYNASQDVANIAQIQSIKPTPKLYYYPNNFEKSLLPFPVDNQNYSQINGYFDRQANENSKAWILNKITFPTGGFSEFMYESNAFQIFGENVTGGGVRIKEQILNDGAGNTRNIHYSYLDDNGKSSGNLPTIPYFGHPILKFFDVNIDDQSYPPVIASSGAIINNVINWKLFDKSNLNKDLTSGAFVGYSKVEEREINNGRKVAYFTSNNSFNFQNHYYRYHPMSSTVNTSGISVSGGTSCIANFIMANSGIEVDNFTDNGYKRGHLLEENIYNESNQLLVKKINEYTDTFYSNYDFIQPITFPVRTAGADNLGHLLNLVKKFEKKSFLKTKETNIEYFSGNSLTKENYFTYNTIGLITTKISQVPNKTVENRYYYPQDASVASEPQANNLVINNILSVPLKEEVFINSIKVGENKKVYGNDATTSNKILPKYIYSKKGNDVNSILEKKVTIDKYDTKGNILQFTKEDGMPVVIIWGYNKTLAVAKIENATYVSIPVNLITAIETASSSTGSESSLLTALTNLRNDPVLVNAMATTYTFNPLVGISTATDSKENVIKYTYDIFGRLLNVKDKDNNTVSENQYNYRP